MDEIKGPCGKLVYKTKMSAENALEDIRLLREILGKRKRNEKNFYFCKICNGFHLTAKY